VSLPLHITVSQSAAAEDDDDVMMRFLLLNRYIIKCYQLNIELCLLTVPYVNSAVMTRSVDKQCSMTG